MAVERRTHRSRLAKVGDFRRIGDMLHEHIHADNDDGGEEDALRALYNFGSHDYRGQRLFKQQAEKQNVLGSGFNQAARHFDHSSLSHDFRTTQSANLDSIFGKAANGPSYTIFDDIALDAHMALARDLGGACPQLFEVLDRHGNLMGSALATYMPSLKRAQVDMVYVEDRFHNMNVSTLLLGQMEDWAEMRGAALIHSIPKVWPAPDHYIREGYVAPMVHDDRNYTLPIADNNNSYPAYIAA